MKNIKKTLALVILFGLAVVGYSSLYIVHEGWQAIITQFGRPIGDPITEAGLHVKVPFIQEVRYVDKRILYWDGDPNQIPTKENKYLMVDTTARWKISDPLTFIQTVQNERGAISRLDDILDSATRDAISSNRLIEAVRNSNQLLERKKKKEKEQAIATAANDGKRLENEAIMGEIGSISIGREKLTQIIVNAADEKLRQFGISLVDVQLRRVAFESSVEQKVFQRMISERKRIAERLRSVGKGEMAKIKGKTQKDLEKIQSLAYRKAQIIRGKAEAKATAIYANAYNRDPGFYSFTRNLEAYERSLADKAEFILSTKSEFLKVLSSSSAR